MIFLNPTQKETDFNTLPQAVNLLISKVEDLRVLLLKQESQSKQEFYMNSIEVCTYIQQKGISMSKSKLYKLVSSRSATFPFHRAGSRLLFYTNELDVWCDAQIKHPTELRQNAIMSIAKSAQNKQ